MSNEKNRRRLFGTDGIRGVANTELSPQLALTLGLAAGHLFARRGEPARFVVGRDSRVSSPMLEAALSAGLCAMGAEVLSPGLMPTPAVACVTRELRADAGIVISASHNPFPDNGIKFFGPDGYKLEDALEAELEALLQDAEHLPRPSGAGVGHIRREAALSERYAAHLEQTVAGLDLRGVRIVIDAANGAASEIAPGVLADLGAEVAMIHCEPDGVNINRDCGALHPEGLRRAVVAQGAAFGVAFDGDADRAILCDETGTLVDGDHMMAISGLHLARQGKLVGGVVVGTIMSNMGLEACLRANGLDLVRTSVGDRHVSERMRRDGYVLGGEKSGHVIFGHLTTTGDGLMTALQILSVMRETGEPLSRLAAVMTEYPQVLLNIRVRDRKGWESDDGVQSALIDAEQALEGIGRINVRASGTEHLVRVMVEGPDDAQVRTVAETVAGVIRHNWGVDAR